MPDLPHLLAFIAAGWLLNLTPGYVGAAYLLYLGLRMVPSRARPPSSSLGSDLEKAAAAPPGGRGLKEIFLGGFWTNVLNPKVALFFLAFVPQFIAPGAYNKGLYFVLLGVLFNLNSIPVIVGWAAFAGWMARRSAVQKGMHWLDRAAGVLFIGFGLKLAFTDAPAVRAGH